MAPALEDKDAAEQLVPLIREVINGLCGHVATSSDIGMDKLSGTDLDKFWKMMRSYLCIQDEDTIELRAEAALAICTEWVIFSALQRENIHLQPEMLEAIAGYLQWKDWQPDDPKAKLALAQRASEVGRDEARIEMLAAGIYLAMTRVDEVQKVRRDGKWWRLPDGTIDQVLPRQLPVSEFVLWLASEVRSATEAFLLGANYPPQASDRKAESDLRLPTDDDLTDDATPETEFIKAEDAEEVARTLAYARRVASPAQRQILEELIALAYGEHKTDTSYKDATTSTARVQLWRLRKKLQDLGKLV